MNYNVLFEGRPGVGKTSIIHEAFTKNGLKYKYFSASTMDPWTDLVGIPKTIEVTDYNGKQVQAVDLIPPADLVINKYDAIFIDELNRAPPKVLNALMEVLQFKSINGKPVPFKFIWAAINPFEENDDYQVEPLDPAFKDRFQIQIKMPYKLDNAYLKDKFGAISAPFIEWWNEQPEAVQFQISPRRLHDAIDFHRKGGDFKDMLYHGNLDGLNKIINEKSELILIEQAHLNNDQGSLSRILSKNISKTVATYLSQGKNLEELFTYVNEDWLSSSALKDIKFFDKINSFIEKSKNSEIVEKSNRIIRSIYDSNPQSGFVSRNLEKFLPILTTEEKQVIEDKKAKLKNLEFSDINVAPEDKNQAQILKIITQFLYPTQSTLPAQSKINPQVDINQIQVTCSNLYSNLSRFLSSGVSLINSEKAKGADMTKVAKTLAVVFASTKVMLELKHEDKPNGVYQKYLYQMKADRPDTFLYKVINGQTNSKGITGCENLAEDIEAYAESFKSFLNSLPNHSSSPVKSRIYDMNILFHWITSSKSSLSASTPDIKSFFYLYNSENHPDLVSFAPQPAKKRKITV